MRLSAPIWSLMLALGLAACAPGPEDRPQGVVTPGAEPARRSDEPPLPTQPQRTKQGTGFFIDADGLLLTVNHVIDGCTRVVTVPSDRAPQSATVLATDKARDVALLRVRGRDFPYIKLAEMPPAGNSTVTVIGIPEGGSTGLRARQLHLLNNRAADLGRAPMPSQRLLMEGASRHGESGGLITEDGEAVGLVAAFTHLPPKVQERLGMEEAEMSVGPGLQPMRDILAGQTLVPGRPAAAPMYAVALVLCR